MAVYEEGGYRSIQFDELDIYQDGEIDQPMFIEDETPLYAEGDWSSPSGLGEEWGQKV